tara:strand:+ start:1380 stop:2942 length:1563 start_codon:yes stop_codon:yes gene_type:complete
MNIDVLALKYRPKFFSEVTGQDFVINTLSNSLDLNKLHNAYLFSGTRGMGKTTIARLFAKSLLCETSITSKPCGKCSACLEIDKGNHLDLIEIDAASRTKVEDTRSLMENVQYSPSSSRFKVYLIDEVHMLSTKSFNALLKTIEEPPSHVKFLMATTEPEKLPDTILSRCLHFKLASASQSTIIDHLVYILKHENIAYDNLSLSIISKNANGSIRDSLSILEQCIAYCNGKLESKKIVTLLGEVDFDIINNIVKSIISSDPKLLIKSLENISSHINYSSLMDTIINIFHKLSLLDIDQALISEDDPHQALFKENVGLIKPEDLQLYYQIALSSKKDFKEAPSKKDHFVMIILRMIYFTSNQESTRKPNPDLKDVNSNTNEEGSEHTKEQKVPTKVDTVWSDAISDMSLSGLTLHLAMQSVMTDIDTKSPTLHINEDKKDIYPKLCIDDLASRIKKYFKLDYDIEIKFTQGLLTPLKQEVMRNESEINSRYDKVKDNPDISKLQKVFGANIDKESIKKIIE